jgi:hypothetical protein
MPAIPRGFVLAGAGIVTVSAFAIGGLIFLNASSSKQSAVGGAPPASGIEAPFATLGQVSPQDAVSATSALASQVAELGDAEAALIQALQSSTTTPSEVAHLQTTLASRGLAVGRSADLLAGTTGQSGAAPASAAAAMYGDVATVAYMQALSVANIGASDLLGPNRTQAIQAIALLSTRLSAGTPAHRWIFAAALGPLYQDNVIAVPVASTGADAPADAVVTASQARTTLTVDMRSLVTPDGTTAAALNSAADPAGGASLQQMAAVAAARLVLHAEQKRASTRAPLNTSTQPLTFDVAKQIVMSKGVLGADTDATLTFFALADRTDIMQMFSFFNKKAPGGVVESPNQMVWLAAVKAVVDGGADRPYVALLTAAITGGGKASAIDAATADSLQRLIFDQYLAIKEPTIKVAAARFVDPNVQIDLSYLIHQGAITVTCAVSGVQETLYLNAQGSGSQSTPDGYAGTETVNLPVDPTAANSWSYSCWSLYGQVGAGEVNGPRDTEVTATDTPRPAAPVRTSTPRPAAPPTSAPELDPTISAVLEYCQNPPTPAPPDASSSDGSAGFFDFSGLGDALGPAICAEIQARATAFAEGTPFTFSSPTPEEPVPASAATCTPTAGGSFDPVGGLAGGPPC